MLPNSQAPGSSRTNASLIDKSTSGDCPKRGLELQESEHLHVVPTERKYIQFLAPKNHIPNRWQVAVLLSYLSRCYEGHYWSPTEYTQWQHAICLSAIPNRAGRSNSLSVPTTPTSLWRLVPVPKAQDVMLTRGLVGSEKCPHAPPGSRRIRPSPCVNVEPDAGLSKHDRAAPSDAPCPPPILPLTLPICPSPVSISSVSPEWGQNERAFLRLWSAEKRNNPHLPLVFSPFNPLRALMPPLYWNP
ncbi:hypothetical protein B0H13DRAFT_1885697 [Mycena leptocephala]|nr:hypothetical protein B0H13DRAFT_1885697 [Mycena leptocephala]